MSGPILHLGWSGTGGPVRVQSGAHVLQANGDEVVLRLEGTAPAVLVVEDVRALQVLHVDPPIDPSAPLRPLALIAPAADQAPRHAVMSDGRLRSSARLFEGLAGFLPDTKIATPEGGKLAGLLKPGDPILTRDAGVQPVLWSGRLRVQPKAFGALFPVAPICIPASGLGPGQPSEPLAVPPHQRVLLAENTAALHFEEREVLVAAADLVLLNRARSGEGAALDLIQILLPAHQIILAGGMWCETLQATPERLSMFPAADRRTVLSLAKAQADPIGAARLMLTRAEAALLRVGF